MQMTAMLKVMHRQTEFFHLLHNKYHNAMSKLESDERESNNRLDGRNS
jgi:competence protein ComGC